MQYQTLANGVKIPQLGYGVYQVTKEECERCVSDAVAVGYRHFDTAQSYFNEEEVGGAIKKSGIAREEFFITTKVWIEHYGFESCKKSVLESMENCRRTMSTLCFCTSPLRIITERGGLWRSFMRKEDSARLAFPIFIPTGWSTFAALQKSNLWSIRWKLIRAISRLKRRNGWKNTAFRLKRGRLWARAGAVF